MMAMHIGIDISRIATAARTGTEHYTYELLAALARIDQANRYTLYCNSVPARLPPLGPAMALRPLPLPRLWTHVRLSAEVLANPPDTLFVPAHVLPLGTPFARRTRAVVTVHDLGYLHFPAAHTRAQRLMLRLTTAWSARVAQRVIAISHATRDDLVRLARVPAEKIAVVHHGVRTLNEERGTRNEERGTRNEERGTLNEERGTLNEERFGFDVAAGADAPYFLYVGTVQPRKNLIRLIEAFAQFSVQPPKGHPAFSVNLMLAGRRGWLSEGIERRAAELGVAERVRFLGYVPDEALPALMAGALAFVFPSLYEGFGMPVLEAMAAGVPVLTSNTSSLPELAGDAALLVDPTDTAAITAGMARLAEEPALRAELRRKGLARAAAFTWERCAEETLRVLSFEFASSTTQN
jgi:glycosyltransferase involved in cell wall biosynthesis